MAEVGEIGVKGLVDVGIRKIRIKVIGASVDPSIPRQKRYRAILHVRVGM
jgi:hypothetical protein